MKDTMIVPDRYWKYHYHSMIVMENTLNYFKLFYGDHTLYHNVVRTLNTQPNLLVSTQVVVHFFLMKNMLEGPIKLSENYLLK